MDIKALLHDFLNSEILVYGLYVYLFCILLYIVYSTLNYFKYSSKMRKTLQSIYNSMSEKEKDRAQNERAEREIHGEGRNKDLLARIDEELAYSGIKDYIKWMNTEIFLVISIVLVAIVVAVTTAWVNPLYGLLAGILTVFTIRLIIAIMANSRDKKTESIMLQFMNIVDNFSKTSDDLVSIFEKASRYIDEPLKTQIYDAVIAARNTGDTIQALQELQDRVRNKHFKVLIRNLEISSRFETNYSDIIEDCRDIFHEYLKSEKEKRNLRMNGLAEILTMMACGGISVWIVGDISEQGNLIDALLGGGALGLALMIYLIVAVVLSLYIAIFQVLRSNR